MAVSTESFSYGGEVVGGAWTQGTVTTAASATVTGSGFTGLAAGMLVSFAAQAATNYTISAIASDTSMTLTASYTGTTGSTTMSVQPTHDTDILNHYMITTTEDDAEFVVRFAVRVTTPSATPATDWAALATACLAIEANLRKRYQILRIDWGSASANQELYNPSVSAAAGQSPSSGFDQEPNLRKLTPDEFPNSGEARGYEFRVRLSQYPNYTDAFGAAAGRRQVDVNMHYDNDQRIVVSMRGEWTQVPSALARAQFLSGMDGISGYAAYRLSKINSTVSGLSAATWTITNREESDPNSLSTLRFSRVYEQHVSGRRGSVIAIAFGESGQRIITIRGTYLRTISGSGGTYGNVYGSAGTSLANFGDGTNGGVAYSVTQLAGLTTAQGGGLTDGSDCELLQEPVVSTNEQNDKTEYTLIYRELLQKQSTAATFLDDPNIVNDTMQFVSVFTEVNDSPTPPPILNGGGTPTPAAPTPTYTGNGGGGGGGGGAGGDASNTGVTTSAPPPVSPVTLLGGSSIGPGGGDTPATKPVDVLVHYEAYFKKTVPNLEAYWATYVFPLLVNSLSTALGGDAGAVQEYVEQRLQVDTTSSRVSCDLHFRLYTSSVILFQFSLGIFNDLGVRVDPAFSGTPHAYLVQQANPKRTMSRKCEAVYKTGSFDLDQFMTPPALQGWVKLADAKPSTVDKILGIKALGVPTQRLTYASLEENLIWVAENVGQASSGGGGGGAGAKGSGGAGAGGGQIAGGAANPVAPAPVNPTSLVVPPGFSAGVSDFTQSLY